MDRRHFLALLSAPAVVALLNACSSDETSPATSAPTGSGPPAGGAQTGAARSELARTQADPRAAVAAGLAFNGFGRKLYRALAADRPDGNLVFSPTSIAFAVTMAAAGARGETQLQMLETMEVGDTDDIYRDTNSLTAELEARNGAGVELSIANSLWGQRGLTFEQTFLDLLATEYGAGLELVDYRAKPDATRVAINEWVEEETKGRIPELLAQGTITADARLTLVNAIYMKAAWLNQFNPEATADVGFTTIDGSAKQVPAMYMSRSMRYAAGDGWQAVELPYEGEDLVMVLIVPDAGALEAYEARINVAVAVDPMIDRPVRLTLPKFDIDSSFSVGDAMQALGMELAFSGDADFSGITSEDELRIGAVVHQANITVDEYGTEAAAATAVIMETTSAPGDEPIELVLDRPFIFAVRDRGTGAELFVGRVGDPTA